MVNISGSPYTILADESEEYVQKVSSYLDSKVTDILSGNRISSLDAMVLAGLNIADDYFKSLELNDSLRSQLKSCLDELSQLKTRLAEQKRETSYYGKNS